MASPSDDPTGQVRAGAESARSGPGARCRPTFVPPPIDGDVIVCGDIWAWRPLGPGSGSINRPTSTSWTHRVDTNLILHGQRPWCPDTFHANGDRPDRYPNRGLPDEREPCEPNSRPASKAWGFRVGPWVRALRAPSTAFGSPAVGG